MKLPKHVAILGAGPAGLATGHELSAHGIKVTVYEKNEYVGGLCRTIEHKGYRFDLGGHRWFTKNNDLNKWFCRLMKDEIVLVNRISRIYYDGKFFFYPIRFGDVLKNTGFLTIAHAGFDFLLAALQYSSVDRRIITMKEAFTAQFGNKLYEMFFRRYSEKVWGRPCEELSADWVEQRSKGLSMWTAIREALQGSKEKVTSLIEEFMYPRHGYVRIPERMAEEIYDAGNEILLGAAVNKIIAHGPRDFELYFQQNGAQRSVRADAIVSTIPLGILTQIIEPRCNDKVAQAARNLHFRDLITVSLILKREQVSRDTWLYIQDQDVLFGRLHEPKNWSPSMVPDDDHTSLVLECFCSHGDHIWQMSDDAIAQRCIKDLVKKLRFIEENEVEDWLVVRTRHAYPVYDLDYAEKTTVIKEYLGTFEGLHIVGRGGTFRYNNADHSIEMGLLLGQRILGLQVDHLAVNTEQEYHEEKRGSTLKRDHYVDSTSNSTSLSEK